MNHDDNITNKDNTLTAELEARVVAWVAGEASPFESAELERLTTDNPAIAIFRRRVQAVQGLVAEAVRPDNDPMRLSPERREKLLKALGVSHKRSKSEESVVTFYTRERGARIKAYWVRAAGLAACVALGVGIVGFFNLKSARETELVMQAERVELPRYEEEIKKSADFSSKKKALEEAVALQEKRKTERFERSTDAKVRDSRLNALAKIGDDTVHRKAQRPSAPAPASAPAPESSGLSQRGLVENSQKFAGSANGWSAHNPPVQIDGVPAQDEVIKLDAFTVSAAKVGNARAIAAQRVAIAPKPLGQSFGLADSTGSDASRDYANAPADEKDTGGLAQQKAEKAADNEVVLLSEFKVASSKEGNAQAMAQQKQAISGKLVAASDQLGSISEGNVGEFLKNLPGAPVSYGAAGKKADNDKPIVTPQEESKPSKLTPAEVITAKEPVSTFSLHVSDVSFKLAKEALEKGGRLDRERIRPEEFYNAFNYGDPSPALNEKISCRIEQAGHPLMQQRNLVRIAMKVAAAGRGAGQPLRLTVLLDTSGSMEREDRAAAVRKAMESLVSLLGPNDEVTLIGFARQPRLLAESVSGDQAGELLKIVANIPADGGTNLEEALKLGRELAKRHFEETAQNRLVLLTDGAANLGNADRAQLAAFIEEMRKEGIAFDACGVGIEGIDDAMLESLSRKGDGRYYVLNSVEDADANFARQLAGALRPAAKNVKLQVRFNPARVRSYRLIGFEKHRLKEEDFRNDKVDAAELAAEEAAVAVYQVEPLPQGEGELGEVFVRFLDVATGQMVERSWTLPYDAKTPAFDRSSPSMQLAGTAALFGEVLQRGAEEDMARLGELTSVVNALRSHYPNNERVDDLVTMFEEVKKEIAK